MRSKKTLAALFVALFVLLLAGCGGKSLTGKWKVTGLKGLPSDASCTMNFEGADKVSTVLEMNNPAGAGKVQITVMGTYTLASDLLTMKFSDAKFDFPGVDENMKKLLEQGMTQGKTQMLDEMNKGSGKVKWDSDDKITVTGTDGSATLERVK